MNLKLLKIFYPAKCKKKNNNNNNNKKCQITFKF